MELKIGDHISITDLMCNILTAPDELETVLDQCAHDIMTGIAVATVRRLALTVDGHPEETHERSKKAIEDQHETTPGSSNSRCLALVDKWRKLYLSLGPLRKVTSRYGLPKSLIQCGVPIEVELPWTLHIVAYTQNLSQT